MIFSWLKRRRRQRLLAQPFRPDWLRILQRNVAHYRWLTQAEQARLRDDLRIFIAEKHWEGCGGLTMTDEIRVTIAAQACLLVLGMEHNFSTACCRCWFIRMAFAIRKAARKGAASIVKAWP
jgi:Mlc titration factor MtfA (ptsG expression regulator)